MAGTDVFSSNTAFPGGGGGGGGGLTNWTEAGNTTAPNATVAANSFTATGAFANIDAIVSAKGTGATLAQVPDSLTTGGNKRGDYATDFQKLRAANTQVASGQYTFLGGGQDNTVSANWATIIGGRQNTASGLYSSIAGGYLGQAAGQYSFVGSGDSSFANANYSFVGSGFNNQITAGATGAGIAAGIYHKITAAGLYSFIGGGGNNTLPSRNDISAASCFIGGGHTNTVSNSFSTIGGGRSNTVGSQDGTIAGGNGNICNGGYGAIGGGWTNSAGSNYAAVAGGVSNSASGQQTFIGGGSTNSASSATSLICGGQGNTISNNNQNSSILGGTENAISKTGGTATYSAIIGGYRANVNYYGEIAHASGQFGAKGDAQTSELVSRRSITVGAAATDLTFDGGAPTTSNTIELANNQAYQFSIKVIAKEDTAGSTQCAWWTIEGGICRGAAAINTALVGANVVNTGNAGGNSAGWTCVAQANTTNGSLQILVSAPAGTGAVRFVATTRLTRVAS